MAETGSLGIVPLACAFALFSLAAHAEIFRCTHASGLPLFQNFPCDADGPLHAHATPARTAVARPGGMSKADSRTATVPYGPGDPPRPGMARDDVFAAWGEPTERIEAADRSETWRYSDGRSVRFDARRKATAVVR